MTVVFTEKKCITATSLFSGCGGTDLALQDAGYDVIFANDLWEKACLTYNDNLRNPKMECGDIRDVSHFRSSDLLVGCYPCQGFTQGGKRDWDAPENLLYKEFARALRLIKPKAFVVENVIGMTFGANKIRLQDQLSLYEEDYTVKWQVLNAKYYGVAQNRRRVFIVGVRRDQHFEYSFPKATHGIDERPLRTQGEVLGGLPAPTPGDWNSEPLHWYYLSRRRRTDWWEPSPCVVGHWRHVPLHPSSPPLQRLSTDEWRFINSGQARRLAYLECAALQGFPPSYKWHHGGIRDRFQMIGNAVPPPLFTSILSSIQGLW